jgi:hypothetical protein
MSTQVIRQRREILQLQRAGINSNHPKHYWPGCARMLANIDNMCAERDRLKKEQPIALNSKALRGRSW